MKLPYGEAAVIEDEKISGYLLSPEHPRGRHKARVFAAALGIRRADANALRTALLDAASHEEAEETHKDEYGCQYGIEFEMKFRGKSARIHSTWIIRSNEKTPRFVTCYVL